ncbi:MAG: prohibitin family protein [Cellulosilyticum sp.]|nr:prohibitin family protein [Cellulosilyticum sp.]
MSTKNVGAAGILVGMTIFTVGMFTCVNKIGPGYAGVIYNMDGGIENETLAQGFHLVAPWKHVSEYPISTETVYYTKNSVDGNDKDEDKKTDKSVNVNTKDGKQVNVSVTYAYHMDVEKLPTVYAKFRGQDIKAIESGYMKNAMYEALNNITSQYSLMELVGDKRPEINQKIFEAFRDDLSDYGIVIETFNLSDVVPDEATATAIQNVVNAQNELQRAKIEKEQAEVEAEKARVAAKGKADAALIEAEGQAQANAKLQQSLTESVLRQRAIEKWSGNLPQVSGSNGGFILGADFLK